MNVTDFPAIESCVVNDAPVRCLHINDAMLVEVHDFAQAVGMPCEPAYAALVRRGAPFIALNGLAFAPAEMVRAIPANDDCFGGADC